VALILALDGALAGASAAVVREGVVLAARRVETERGQAALLPELVVAVLRDSGIAATALDAVGVTVGPGGFTGLRAALSLAQGIALGVGIAAIGVTTGEALAAALPEGSPIWALIDTKRGRVVLERIDSDGAAGAAESLAIADLQPPGFPVRLVGDAAASVLHRLPGATLGGTERPDAVGVAAVARRRLAGRLAPLAAHPRYVEPPAVRPPAA